MHYMTMVLELLKQLPKKYNQLRRRRMMVEALEFYARKLNMSLEAWLARHFQAGPGRSESQLSGEALEMALQEMENFLYSETPSEGSD